jgi:hypothetical protein
VAETAITLEMCQIYLNGVWLPPVPYPFQARLGLLHTWKTRPPDERMWLEGIVAQRREW